jgi:hypothetical protein
LIAPDGSVMLVEGAQRTDQDKRRERAMKVQIIVNITHEDHSEAVESTAIEVNVPEFEAFSGPENFGEVFDQYERTVLKARKEVVAAAPANYLSDLAKKKPSLKQSGEQGE